MNLKNLFLSLLFFSLTLPMFINGQTLERKDIDEKYKWDLTDLYENNDLFLAELNSVDSQIPKISEFQGKLNEGAETLYNALRTYFDVTKSYVRLIVYSYRLSDENTGISSNQELRQKTQTLGTKLSEASSFIEPEILLIDSEKIDRFFESKKELEEFRVYIDDIQRMKDHTLSPNEEKILASAGMITRTPSTIYSIFDNSEKPLPKVTLSNGEEIELNYSVYGKYRASANRADRKNVMSTYFNSYKDFQNTLGANLAGKVRGDYFYAKNRKYNSSLEYALDQNNIPVSVYENLITQVNENLPTMHRALELKKRMLGLDTLHYYDLYIPFVKDVDMTFTVEEGQDLLLKALKPMGEKYIATVKKAFDERWIDYYPTKGKRSGAYSSGSAYDVHPYILLNWIDDYDAVSTLGHEIGHTMHSYFSNMNQPYVNSGYSTFVAEIASTINENFLNDYMIANVKSDDEKLYLLGSVLELLRTTIFRQVSFAEFELEIHKRIENGEPLTGETMSQIYFDIVKKYYGHDLGVCNVGDYIAYEWSYIHHFLGYTYYVFQYSTSLIYSTAFSEKIQTEGQPAIDKFYEILKGGSSEYPIDLIRKAGIEPLSSEAFDLTMAKMNKIIDQIEEIIKK